jgi:cytosine/adenosine deaminase-related metal-dependent hydrolase
MDDCGGRSPVQRAHELGLLNRNLFAIHCNYLAAGDAELLAKNQVTVVHCPRSHAYFKHAPFRYELLRRAGVKIALGTDSLASVRTEKNRIPTLDLWEEMRAFALAHLDVPGDQIIEMATIAGGLFSNAGALRPKYSADMIALSFSGAVIQFPEIFIDESAHIANRWLAGLPF